MTEMIYFPSADACYQKEFEAEVVEIDTEENAVILDKTAFYPLGGGQEDDKGVLIIGGQDYPVKKVRKRDGTVYHYIDDVSGIDKGAKVKGVIDWDNRYGNMRMHTAQHIVSAIVKDLYNADTVGNQLYPDRARIDFQPLDKATLDISAVESKFAEIVDKALDIKIYEEDREILMNNPKVRTNMKLIPESIKRLRTVEVDGYDLCPCAGTHVRNTSELAPIEIYKTKSKGSGKLRIEYRFRE